MAVINTPNFSFICKGINFQKNAHQPIFPYNIVENSPTFFDHTSVFIDPNNLKFGTETRCMEFGAN